MIALVFALAAAAPAPVAAPPQSPVQATPAAPATKATAAALARAVAPGDLMIPYELEQAHRAIVGLPPIDEDAKALEGEYPGIWAAVWAAIEPEMRQWVEADYPGFWAALEQMYVARLTEPEAQALLTFYRSATGRKLIRGMIENFDAMPMVKDVVAAPDSAVTAETLNQATRAAQSRAVAQIGREDVGELMILIHYVPMEKFRAIGAETQQITLDWVNKPDPEGDKRLQRLMEDAIQRYKTAHPPAKRR
jgi:uncharacterized protein DUF2059